MDDLSLYLGARLVEERKRRGKLQPDVAAALRKSVSWVSEVERGEQQLYVRDLVTWCAYLGIDPGVLLGQVRDDDPALN